MLILVSMRIAENTSYPECRDALSHDWGYFFDRHRLTPILVPNSLADPGEYWKLGAKGLVLTGGDSMGSKEQPTARDVTEAKLIDSAIGRGIPIFGVCRGLQVLNRYFGGQNGRLEDRKHVGEHAVELLDGRSMQVNSFHTDAVLQPGLATPLVPFAMAQNGIVEGYRHESLPITAIQWHPERASPSATYDEILIEDWVRVCAS